jgi:hypothetical protein
LLGAVISCKIKLAMDKAEKIKNAWNNYYRVTNSEGMRCGNMICHKCKEEIKGDYLIQDRSNHLLRGNEHDECYIFHRKCSEDNITWKDFDENMANEKVIELQKAQIKKVSDLITKYGLESVFYREKDDD